MKARAEFRRRLMSNPANHAKNELGALADKMKAMRALRAGPGEANTVGKCISYYAFNNFR